MLSSGALNLKFMQRNNNNKNQNLKKKIESTSSSDFKTTRVEQLTSKNSQDASGDLLKGKDKSNDRLSSIHLDQSFPPTCTIIYEESLIHFPFLYSNRLTSSSSCNTTLPVHLGRQSFGHSSKSTQNPDQTSSPNKRMKHDSSRSQRTQKPSKKMKTESQDSLKSSSQLIPHAPHQVQTQSQAKSSSTSNGRIANTFFQDKHREPEETSNRDGANQAGFKKPFNSTTIKTKRKSTTDLTIPSANQSLFQKPRQRDISPSSKPIKPIEMTTSNHRRKRESISIDDDKSSDSDDTEMVKNQIEMMFKEARNAQISSKV